MCDHIISTVFRAESCKQLAACLFRGKIWMQYLILFKSVTFCYHLLSHNHRLNDRWWPFLHFVHRQVIVVIPKHQQVTTHRQVIDVHLFKMFCFRFSLADPVGLLQEHDIWRMIYLQPCAKRRSIRYVEKVPFSSLFCRFRSANYHKNHCRAYPLGKSCTAYIATLRLRSLQHVEKVAFSPHPISQATLSLLVSELS